MLLFRYEDHCKPQYQTPLSSGADLRSRVAVTLQPGEQVKIATGVWIERVLWEQVPVGAVPEVQIRARSGLAFKHGVCLTNGVGTVDADYPDEICVLLWNTGKAPVAFQPGDRIAQLVLTLTYRSPDLSAKEGVTRSGGFGSTHIS